MTILITRLIATVMLLSLIGGACYGLYYVWTHPVSIIEKWKKDAKNSFPVTTKTAIPLLKYGITYLPTKYANGLIVDGVAWNDDFKEYRLAVKNANKDTEAQDVRINMDLPGGVVQYKILSEAGCSGLRVHDADIVGGGLAKKDGVIYQTVKQYSNNFYITVDKLFPEAYFEVRLILKVLPSASNASSGDGNGIFEASFRYLNTDQKLQNKRETFKLIYRENGALHIDTENPLSGSVMRSTGIVFDTPLSFGNNGSAKVKENPR